jgi:dTDP-4-amino-4,6-dideoxygalactose transaminase
MELTVPLSDLDFGYEEEAAVLDVLRRRWLTMGAVTAQFEAEFAQQMGVKHALAVSNGTHALHLACLAAGLGPGDEVIVPALTFVATANAVLYTGADVRFADILGMDELNISP